MIEEKSTFGGKRLRRVVSLTVLLLGLVSLLACSAAGWGQPTPTVYYAPATPAVYIPPVWTPDPQTPVEATTVLLMGIASSSTIGVFMIKNRRRMASW